MKMFRFLIVLAAVMASTQVTRADTITIDVNLFSFEGYTHKLVGQSAFVQEMTNGGSSGGQLDSVMSPGASLVFEEIFPPPTIDGYLTFSYFGLVETYDSLDVLVATNLVVGLINNPVNIVGFPVGYVDDLVAALGSSFDSPEFFDFKNQLSDPDFHGVHAIPSIARDGVTLNLVSFNAPGVYGEAEEDYYFGTIIGTLAVTVEPSAEAIPEPASLALASLASLALLRRRR
jgi:MYXO-CTERM domain-containing protein